MEKVQRDNLIFSEQSVAGSILIDDWAYRLIAEELSVDDFLSEPCRAIFEAAAYLDQQGKPVDLPLIQSRLREVGASVGNDYLIQLMEITPTSANCVEYARLVKQDSQRRKVRALCQSLLDDDTSDANALISALHSGVESVLEGVAERGCISSSECMVDLLNSIVERSQGRRAVLSTGFQGINRILGGGFSPGSLVVLAGRPGMGKSTLGLALAENMANQGTVLYITLEMTAEQISAKRIARGTGIPAQRLLLAQGRNSFTADEMDKVRDAAQRLSASGLVVNRQSRATVDDIRTLARSQNNLCAVVIDHLGLIKPRDSRGRSRTEQVTEISAALKEMALSLKVPVLALCQLNRANEQTQEKRPVLSHLRDSGSIEQDADVVILLHREDYYDRQKKIDQWSASLVEIDFAKNRFGRNQVTYLNCYLATDRFTEV